MKIRTLDDLSNTLSSQLAWRKKELSEIKYLLEAASIPKHKKNLIIRSSVTMIYAHWEGFLKIAGRYYLEYIYSLRLKNSDLAKSFLIISAGASTSMLENSEKYSTYESVIDFFEQKLESKAKIPFKSVINTESNLSSSVLREIIWCLNLSYDSFEIKEKLIDERMLAKRNHIAHGEYLEIDAQDVIDLRNEILALMIEFKNQIENSALIKGFLKQ